MPPFESGTGPPRRRAGLAALVVAVAVVLAGCGGTLVAFESSPATIPADALGPSGYVHGNTTEVPVTYPVGVAGVSRDVTVQTWLAGYSRTTADDRTAALVLFSSPDLEVANTSVNPLSQLDNRQLVGFVLDRATDLRGIGGVEGTTDLREVGERPVTVLGTATSLVSYTGTAEVDGQRLAVVVDLVVVRDGGDVVVALGVYDATLDEAAAQAALVERTVHGG